MRRRIGGLVLFVAGIGVGVIAAQQNRSAGLRLNHVGIYTKDFDASLRFYKQVVGLREAFTIRSKEGKVVFTYLHINRDTFLELTPATPDHAPGLSHIGIWPEDFDGRVAALRQRGAKVDDPRIGSSKARITNVLDPDGVAVEFLEYTPGSLQRKAIDDWK